MWIEIIFYVPKKSPNTTQVLGESDKKCSIDPKIYDPNIDH
jgi:hypothetical protein